MRAVVITAFAALCVVAAMTPQSASAQCTYRMNDVGRSHGYLSGPCNGAAQNYNGAYRSRAASTNTVTSRSQSYSDRNGNLIYAGVNYSNGTGVNALATGWFAPPTLCEPTMPAVVSCSPDTGAAMCSNSTTATAVSSARDTITPDVCTTREVATWERRRTAEAPLDKEYSAGPVRRGGADAALPQLGHRLF
jgi:hypothetical protein